MDFSVFKGLFKAILRILLQIFRLVPQAGLSFGPPLGRKPNRSLSIFSFRVFSDKALASKFYIRFRYGAGYVFSVQFNDFGKIGNYDSNALLAPENIFFFFFYFFNFGPRQEDWRSENIHGRLKFHEYPVYSYCYGNGLRWKRTGCLERK